MTASKRPFLVLYDQGKIGALWGIVEARTADEIRSLYPELEVVEQAPEWMSEGERTRLIQTAYDIDGAPHGMLNVVLAGRYER